MFWLTISCVKGVGDKTLIELYEKYPQLHFDNIKEHLESSKSKRLSKLLSDEHIEAAKEKAEKLIEIHKKNDIHVIPISSESYPNYLKLIHDPPAVLYAKGNIALLKEENTLAVVGTRKPTEIGLKSAQKISTTFAERGYTIVSGLALGIDTAGHEGALHVEGGKTIAVMAGELTKIYQAKNKGLADEILNKNGLLL